MWLWKKIKEVLQQNSNVRNYLQLPFERKKITFYAEDAESRMYYGEIIEILTQQLQQEICYLTSDSNDPILKTKNKKINSFYVGMGSSRSYLFYNLNCKLLILTMPDLQTFYIKRSKAYNVKYLYIFHAIASMHMVYRKGAFDHYDVIFLTGPFQIEEFRKTEKLYGMPKKELFEFGYPRLDHLLESDIHKHERKDKIHILLAPSWGPDGTLENYADKICGILLKENFSLTVRPHPRTRHFHPQLCNHLKEKFSQYAEIT